MYRVGKDLIPNPNNVKLFSLRKTGIEKAFSDFGFRVFSADLLTKGISPKKVQFDKLLKEVKYIQPHIFYFFKDEYLPAFYFKKLREVLPNTKFIMRYWDQRGVIPECIRRRKGLIDTLIINNRDPKQYQMYKNFGIPSIRTLYNSVSETNFFSQDIKRPYEVFFGGSNYNRKFPLSDLRRSLIYSLRDRFKTVIRGDGWDFPCSPIVRRNQYSRALQLANINIGINHYNIVRYYSERTIQNPASGRLHITYYIPEMEKDFGSNHTNLVWFNSIPECIELVNFYLKNNVARKKIESAGREFILDKFGTQKWLIIFANIFFSSLGYNVPITDY